MDVHSTPRTQSSWPCSDTTLWSWWRAVKNRGQMLLFPQALEIQVKGFAQKKKKLMSCRRTIDLSLPVRWTAHTDEPESHHPHRPGREL